MPKEFVNNSKIKNVLLTVKLNGPKDEITRVSYHYGTCFNTSNIYPSDLIKVYNGKIVDDNILIKNLEILCQFDPQKCFDLYNIITNKHLKDLIIEAVRNTYKKYAEYNHNKHNIIYKQNLFKGNFERAYYEFYIKLNTWFASLTLDDNNKIIKGEYQTIKVFNAPFKSSGQKEYLNPTQDNIIYLSNLICQGNLEEYENLLNTINHNTKEYKAIINGGSLYTNKIRSLEKALTKK